MRHWARIPPLPRVGSNIIGALTDLLMCLWRHDTSGRTRARARLQAGDARPRNDHGRSRLGLRAQRKPDGQEKTKANHFNGTAHSLPSKRTGYYMVTVAHSRIAKFGWQTR